MNDGHLRLLRQTRYAERPTAEVPFGQRPVMGIEKQSLVSFLNSREQQQGDK
jgi:hypothetical protein